MHIITDIALSILSGLVASAVFLFILFRLRPKIEISPWIARQKDQDEIDFAFKAINRSSRPCHNVCVEATLAQPKYVNGGITYWTTTIEIKKPKVFQMERFDETDTNAHYAWRFVTGEDLDALWDTEDSIIRFRVLATDSVTNFSRVFTREFHLARDSIKDGTHNFGADLGVS